MTYDPFNEYKYKVGLGQIANATTVNKWGFNQDVDSGAEEIIAAHGGTPTIMTTADTLDCVSTSSQDAVGGTGASLILITGIGADFLSQEEYVTLTGVTPVTTSNTWLGVNRVVVITSGSNDANVGTITIDDTANTVGVQASIPINGSVTQQAMYHTQVGYTLMLDWLFLNCRKNAGGGVPRVEIKGYSYSRVTDTTYLIFEEDIDTNTENTVQLTPTQPFIVGGREVIYFTANTSVNDTIVNCRFSGIEVLNS